MIWDRIGQEEWRRSRKEQPPIVSWLTYPVSASGRDLSCLLCVEGLTELRVDSGHTLLDTPLSRGVLVHDHCTQLCHTHAAKSYQRPRATGVNVRMWRQSINMCQPPAAKHSTNTTHLRKHSSSHNFEECTVLQRMLGQDRQRDRAARVARMGVERHQAYTHVRTVTHH